jgi:hypothetical protein
MGTVPVVGAGRRIRLLAVALCLTVTRLSAAQEPVDEVATPTVTPSFIAWRPHVPYAVLTLNVALPTGDVLRREFTPGQPIGLDVADAQAGPLPDGSYTYELLVTPQIDPGVKQALAQARKADDAAGVEEIRRHSGIPPRPLTQTGYFTINQGAIVLPAEER